MADFEPDLAPASTTSTDYELAHLTKGDQNLEQLLSEKLMKGYTLCNGGCPICLTPLIKNELVKKKNRLTTPLSDPDNKFPILVASESFEQPFTPVAGVPFCVLCQAHVVTSEADVDALEQSESFKDKGSILVALHDDEQRESLDGNNAVEHVPSTPNYNPAADDGSEDGTSSFTKSLSSIMKESESILGRPVDPNRFTTTLFCGTTASRQVVSSSPVNGHAADKEQVSDPYNEDFGGGKDEYDATAFADALEEDAEEVDEDVDEDVEDDVDEPQASTTDIDEEEDDGELEDVDPEDMMVEYSIRREMAAKLLGSKLLEGYALRDSQCLRCGMPMMEYKGKVDCVICPVLTEKTKSGKTSSTLPYSPVDRKTRDIEQRWATEATTVAKQEEMRLLQATLEREAEELRQLEALKGKQATETDDDEQRQLKNQDLEVVQSDRDQRMREIETSLLEQERRVAMEAYRMELLSLAARTKLPMSPAGTTPRGMDPSGVNWPMSSPSSPRVQALIDEMEEEEDAYLREARTFVKAVNLEDFDNVKNLPVHTLSPRAASILKEALYLEDTDGIRGSPVDALSPRDKLILSPRNYGADRYSSPNSRADVSEEEAQFQEARSYVETMLRQEKDSSTGVLSPRSGISIPNRPPVRSITVDASEEIQLLEARLFADAMLLDEVKAAENARQHEESILAEKARIEYEAMVAEQSRLAEEERKAEEKWVLEETRRLELLEEKRIIEEALNNESKFRDGDFLRHAAVSEGQRQRQIEVSLEEAQRLAEIEGAEEARRMEGLHMKHAIAQKRAEEKDILLAKLEKDADEKRIAAEKAMLSAQAAMSQAAALRRESLATTIAQAEVEVLEETEAMLEADYKMSALVKKSAEEIEMERWEILRAEGRSTLTRRMMHGWKLNDDLCRGEHCRHSPIVEKSGKMECVVCGGTGSGCDGVYAVKSSTTDDEDDDEVVVSPPPVDLDGGKHGELLSSDFESKRHLVSQEIGKKMIEGWLLLDLSCPICVMPLMSDGEGGQETCVICGPVALDAAEEENQAVVPAMNTKDPTKVPEIIRRQISKDPDTPRSDRDPPESSKSYHHEASPRYDPPAFFGNDYEESPKVSTAASGANCKDMNDSFVALPEGVDMDDDLMSVAKAAHDDEPKEIDNEFAGKAVIGTVEFSSDANSDDVSHMTGTTWNNNTPKRGSSAKVNVGKPTATSSTASSSGNNRLPPRPGHSSQRPPTTPDRNSVVTRAVSSSPQRRGPPRPEEAFTGSGTRKSHSSKSLSPASSTRSPMKKSLAASLAELRDRDDFSAASEGLRSRAETVTSEALDVILERIGECKTVLTTSDDVNQQREMAGLIEQLASAAVAVKKLEDMGVY